MLLRVQQGAAAPRWIQARPQKKKGAAADPGRKRRSAKQVCSSLCFLSRSERRPAAELRSPSDRLGPGSEVWRQPGLETADNPVHAAGSGRRVAPPPALDQGQSSDALQDGLRLLSPTGYTFILLVFVPLRSYTNVFLSVLN